MAWAAGVLNNVTAYTAKTIRAAKTARNPVRIIAFSQNERERNSFTPDYRETHTDGIAKKAGVSFEELHIFLKKFLSWMILLSRCIKNI
ncbi:MAG: hypothetical protein F6K42_19035 [Leptolyngbya sp. SIO1D8]|nr:hypothetical protein [Leptolyngbya sp. SIO1D8]